MYVLHRGVEENWGRFGATGYSQPPPKHPPLPDDQQKLAGMKQDGVDEEEDVDKTLQECPNLQHIRGKLLGSFLKSIGVSQLCDFTTHCID